MQSIFSVDNSIIYKDILYRRKRYTLQYNIEHYQVRQNNRQGSKNLLYFNKASSFFFKSVDKR